MARVATTAEVPRSARGAGVVDADEGGAVEEESAVLDETSGNVDEITGRGESGGDAPTDPSPEGESDVHATAANATAVNIAQRRMRIRPRVTPGSPFVCSFEPGLDGA